MQPLVDCEERWKSIPGYAGCYEVSSFGQVRSVERFVTYNTGKIVKYPSVVLSQTTSRHGYNYVTLRLSGKSIKRNVHKLVIDSFVQKIPGKEYANHIDGDKTNSKISNLEWVDKRENQIHATRILRKGIGETHSHAKLNLEQVSTIRELIPNISLTDIARKFGVSLSCISSIKSGRTWSL